MKRLLVQSACLLFCVAALAQTPNWKEYQYPKDGFAITSPFKPRLEEQVVNTDAGKLEMHSYTIEVGPLWSLIVSVNDLSKFGDMPAKELLQAAKKGSADEVKAQVTSEKEISLDGTPGIEYQLETADQRSWVRCYYAGGKTIAMLSATGSKSPYFPDTERFFSSLRLIPSWKTYEYASDGFAISAPFQPSFKTQSTETAAGKVEIHFYKIDLGTDTGIMLNITDYGSGTKLSPESLARVKEATVQSVKGRIVAEKDISLDNNPGIEFEMMGAEGYHSRGRYYIVGNKLLAIVSYAGEGNPLPPDSTRMLESLRLLKSQ